MDLHINLDPHLGQDLLYAGVTSLLVGGVLLVLLVQAVINRD